MTAPSFYIESISKNGISIDGRKNRFVILSITQKPSLMGILAPRGKDIALRMIPAIN